MWPCGISGRPGQVLLPVGNGATLRPAQEPLTAHRRRPFSLPLSGTAPRSADSTQTRCSPLREPMPPPGRPPILPLLENYSALQGQGAMAELVPRLPHTPAQRLSPSPGAGHRAPSSPRGRCRPGEPILKARLLVSA